MQQVKNILVLQKMLSRVHGEVLSRVCLINNEFGGGWKSQEATPRHTHTHTHTHTCFMFNFQVLPTVNKGQPNPWHIALPEKSLGFISSFQTAESGLNVASEKPISILKADSHFLPPL